MSVRSKRSSWSFKFVSVNSLGIRPRRRNKTLAKYTYKIHAILYALQSWLLVEFDSEKIFHLAYCIKKLEPLRNGQSAVKPT